MKDALPFVAVELTAPQKHCCRATDTYFWEAVAVSLPAILPIKAANTSIMD